MSTYKTVYDRPNNQWRVVKIASNTTHSRWDTEKEARATAFDLHYWALKLKPIEIRSNVIPFRKVFK